MISPTVISAGLLALSCQRGGNNIQRFTELRFGDGERVEEANNVAVNAAAQEQQPFVQRALLNLTGKFRRRLSGLRIAKFHRHHRALPTDIGDIRTTILRFIQHLDQMMPEMRRAGAEIVLVNHIQHRMGRRNRQRVTRVFRCPPGAGASITSARPETAESGIPPARLFAMVIRSGFTQ